jgi:hypothetical protein
MTVFGTWKGRKSIENRAFLAHWQVENVWGLLRHIEGEERGERITGRGVAVGVDGVSFSSPWCCFFFVKTKRLISNF